MRLAHTVARLSEGTGGPAESIPALCRELASAGHVVTLVTGSGMVAPSVSSLEPEVTVRFAPLGPYAMANFSFAYRRLLREVLAAVDLVHTHGLWLDTNWASVRSARRRDIPVVVSPRGMLSPNALSRGRWRKRLSWAMLDGPGLRAAALIHATSPAEAGQIRAAGIDAPIAIVPNGVDVGTFRPLEETASESGARRRKDVLFLSRVHPIKGIDLLLQAWTRLRRAGVVGDELVLAGPGEPGHLEWLHGLLRDHEGQGVRYVGSLQGGARLRALRDARVVVLPSYSENYGMVVAEALSCGTPVITTTRTPWSALATEECGWFVDATNEALAAALQEALSASSAELDEMGRRGRAFVEREHSIVAAGQRMIAAYEWVLDRGARPPFVLDRSEAA